MDSVGSHFLAELYDCEIDVAATGSGRFVALTYAAVKTAGLIPLGHVHHVFPDGGMTLVVALAESHLSVHTWPEKKFVTLDVFVCHHTENHTAHGDQLFRSLITMFAPGRVSERMIERG